MNEERLIDIITRRQILQGGILASAAALLAGCQAPQRVSTNVPGPVWPDMEPGLEQPPLPPVIQPQQPNVSPQPRPMPGPIGGVVPRSRWTSAGVIASRVNPMNGISRITVHHEGNLFTGSTDPNAIARKLSNIRNGHINRRPEAFADIGYHYIIDPAGRVWEGRPLRYQGAHVEKRNEHNLGIMVMGNFEEQKPTTAQLSTLERFVIDQMRRYQISVGNLFTHKELGGTLCPGKNLQRWMLAQRSPAGSFARI
ncbi:MAG: peptidoglycan recognition family protein [Planctomycetota bacterium]|nr:peptidoglycan recognition family protein [Planctomycetota bacterium]